uniref:Hypothetical chloroplast RF1 n=1 Tax=Golenkinia longispicula TaxID=204992 RepID=A0A0S2ID07_9CHLO|nr:hypothetical chloroplast RF1 [Golenkinia longispicula]
MYTFLSVVTSVKDYIEIVNKFVESDANLTFHTYFDFGAIITYIIFALKQFIIDLFSLSWISSIWSIPVIVPDIASAMISEISVLDGYFHNVFTFLETPISYGNQNLLFYCLEKFTIGIINSVFLCIPTSTAHIITLRRFVMQGLEAGSISGLGTIAGNVVWIASIIFGWRFLTIPWLSLDILRYLLGFMLLTKYMWDSYTERRMVLEDISKWKIFLLNFLLAFTEQTSIYPFITNISIGPDASVMESFPAGDFVAFVGIHSCYIFGILIGSLSLLQLSCWFWENPAFQFYMWMISSFRVTTGLYHKFLNFAFLYATMICAISSVAYYGLDYTVTHPLGFVHEDRLLDQKTLLETAFLSTKASDRNTRRNRGRHGRRERWKRRVRRYRTFDSSLYDQGVYDLFTIEDLNYGFDRFWLRRKMRNHRVRFRFFPGPWMRSFKKQLARPRLESFMGPRVEFFRILFEQAYHPSFHEFDKEKTNNQNKESIAAFLQKNKLSASSQTNQINKEERFFNDKRSINISLMETSNTVYPALNKVNTEIFSLYAQTNKKERSRGVLGEFSALRKFVRKVNNRIKMSKIKVGVVNANLFAQKDAEILGMDKPIYSKKWKQLFSKLYKNPFNKKPGNIYDIGKNPVFEKIVDGQDSQLQILSTIQSRLPETTKVNGKSVNTSSRALVKSRQEISNDFEQVQKQELGRISLKNSRTQLSKKDFQILKYRTFLSQNHMKNLLITNDKFSLERKHGSNQQQVGISSVYSKKNENETGLVFGEKVDRQNLELSRDAYKKEGFLNLKPLTLLHPIKFYLHKEQAFRRKLKYYGSNIFRNLSIENNAPYFRVMMRRFFYYYKPTLRWERTMRTATLRKARRKGPRIPRRVNINKNIKARASHFFVDEKNTKQGNFLIPEVRFSTSNSERSQIPTHFYSLVEKRATRYRYQIYKDVLQHWYYSPFNRLLLKFDVDSFIRRQPYAHFLTKREEHLLHLRRFLLSEHYDTIRWYTYMQHYRSMKSNIGGTKSLASRVYNQQFQGTFKKIRHLFSMTPSLTDHSVLKFDQPLYNEYPNQLDSILNDSVIHEELFADSSSSPIINSTRQTSFPFIIQKGKKTNHPLSTDADDKQNQSLLSFKKPNSFFSTEVDVSKIQDHKDLISQSTQIIREYLTNTNPIRQKLINKLLQENNFWELTEFLYKGQKVRGVDPVTGTNSFLEQEKNNLYTPKEKTELKKQEQEQLQFIYGKIKQEIWISLIKKCYARFYDQEALKNYLTRRLEKREKRKQIQEKHLKNRLQRIKNWVAEKQVNSTYNSITPSSGITKVPYSPEGNINLILKGNLRKDQILTTSIKKAIKDAIYLQKDKKQDQSLLKFPRTRIILNKTNSLKTIENHFENRLKNHLYKGLNILPFYQIYLINQINNNKNNTRKTKVALQNPFKMGNSDRIFRLYRIAKTPISSLKKTISHYPKKFLYKIFNLLKAKKSKQDLFLYSLQDFRSKERVLTKRKRTRKRLKRLKKKKSRDVDVSFTNPDNFGYKFSNFVIEDRSSSMRENLVKDNKTEDNVRKKFDREEIVPPSKSWEKWMRKIREHNQSKQLMSNGNIKKTFVKLFTRNFKTKRSRRRRSRRMRPRGAIRKRTLGDKIKRQFKILRKYGDIADSQDRKTFSLKNVFQMITGRNYKPENEFLIKEPKQRRSLYRKHLYWKKHKRPKYAQNRRKKRKRRRSAIGKIRGLNKQLKRTKNEFQIKKWWWHTFLPSLQAATSSFWQIEKNKQITDKISFLSSADLIERDTLSNFNQNYKEKVPGEKSLQLGDRDYKPLAIPEALRIRENLIKKQNLKFEAPKSELMLNDIQSSNNNVRDITDQAEATIFRENGKNNQPDNITTENTVNKLYQNTFDNTIPSINPNQFQILSLKNINPIPFYAGWDESLRKFVVTNRLLSRREAGYEMNFKNYPTLNNLTEKSNQMRLDFSNFPLKGMNAATTLYWQIPFTTYDPDQFFALGMDGFSPIGWKYFHFRHAAQTAKPILVKTKTISYNIATKLEKNELSFNIKMKLLNWKQSEQTKKRIDDDSKTREISHHRRIKKRYRRVKKHPRPPVWFPSGPLLSQVLPVHYIYVFYKRHRLPRDRFIRRRFRRGKKGIPQGIRDIKFKFTDFTLRKRAKPRRRYHRKRTGRKIGHLYPRRRQFKDFPFYSKNSLLLSDYSQKEVLDNSGEQEMSLVKRVRPIPRKRTARQLQDLRLSKMKSKQRRSTPKQQPDNMRIRQLRRRVQRQVIRPFWRYRPRAGGLVWPGDYLRLDLVKSPKLKKNQIISTQVLAMKKDKKDLSLKQIRRKKKRNIQEWQIQPKRYLLQKHNIKVLKKRLEKAQRVNKINQKINELTYFFKR